MVNVSMDKLIVEYQGVTVGYFLGWYARQLFQSEYKVRRTEYKKLFVYQLNIRLEQGVYLHLFYQNFRETSGGLYTLWLETQSEHYEGFSRFLAEFRERATSIVFVSYDVAYDVAAPLADEFVISHHMRRKLREHKGTRYHRLPHQRKQNGYCRVYDKHLELQQRHGIENEDDLTRVEVVYKPKLRTPQTDILQHPPEQNQ